MLHLKIKKIKEINKCGLIIFLLNSNLEINFQEVKKLFENLGGR